MQKNWYILYTKPGKEKKTAALLNRRKIENFFPQTTKETRLGTRTKVTDVPLFPSYLFVNTTAAKLGQIKQLSSVISLVYWKGQPAIVSTEELEAIKDFSHNYRFVKVIRTKVVENERATISSPSYSLEGTLLSVKHMVKSLRLPSLGFTMVTEMENLQVIGREVKLEESNLVI